MAKKRILIIDDMAIFREPISVTLEANGFKTLMANNGKDALKLIETQVALIDLIIVDYKMPEMNGIQFLEDAKTYPSSKNAKYIFLTDAGEKEIVMSAYKAGANEYILKSDFSVPYLLETVNKCFHQEQSEDL